jgi:hypothetical protein
VLVHEYCIHEEQLRADLQQYYSIDMDDAMRGAHSVHHISCLLVQLPPDARIRTVTDPDSYWTLNDTLLASVLNSVNSLIYGMSDKQKRGRKPDLIGPSWMRRKQMHSLPARALPVDELKRILSKPRGVK